jgi:hypothetical protein
MSSSAAKVQVPILDSTGTSTADRKSAIFALHVIVVSMFILLAKQLNAVAVAKSDVQLCNIVPGFRANDESAI